MGLLSKYDDYETDGLFTVVHQEAFEKDDIKLVNIKGVLTLNKEKMSLSTFFHPEIENLTKVTETNETSNAVSGALLIKNSDCVACHNEKIRTIGPAYLTIAKKYNEDKATIDMLAQKIIKGGSGVWGDAIMTPHPEIVTDDAVVMVEYILGLDDQLSKPFDKFSIGIKSVPVKLPKKFDQRMETDFWLSCTLII